MVKRWIQQLLVRPFVWGVLYLALIPAFAFAFSLQPPKSFYEPSLKRERSWLQRDANVVGQHLTAALHEQLMSQHQDGYLHAGNFLVPINKLSVAWVQPTDDEKLYLGVRGKAYLAPKRALAGPEGAVKSARAGFEVPVNVDYSTQLISTSPSGQTSIAIQSRLAAERFDESVNRPDWEPPVGMLFPSPGTPNGASGTDSGTMVLNPAQMNRLLDFAFAVWGDPSQASGYYLRMAYLSVVTVTTLGFGDITPLTTSARILVGAEAILGVVFAGLFLNAITGRRDVAGRNR